MTRKVLVFINTYRWLIYLVWTVPTFFIWSYLGYQVWEEDPDAPGMLYLAPAWAVWFLLHLCTAIILAIVLKIWQVWQIRKRQPS